MGRFALIAATVLVVLVLVLVPAVGPFCELAQARPRNLDSEPRWIIAIPAALVVSSSSCWQRSGVGRRFPCLSRPRTWWLSEAHVAGIQGEP